MPDKMMVAKPKPKHRRPNRKRFKKQITVRIDELLLEAALNRASEQDPPQGLTDAVEAGLWLYLRQKKGTVVRGRFMWDVISQELQELTTGFWSWISRPSSELGEEYIRQAARKLIDIHRGTQECASNLQTLAGSAQETHEAP